MKHRKLRIARSVAWGVLAVLLCGLWVRSYWWADVVFGEIGKPTYSVVSFDGIVAASFPHALVPRESSFIEINNIDAGNDPAGPVSLRELVTFDSDIVVPTWLIVLTTCLAAALPYVPWSKRFSLRTLLIATTVVAVALGIIAWMSRAG